MNKKTVAIVLIIVLFLAVFVTAASFAFFANVHDSSYLEIGSNNEFSVSVGVGETQGLLTPVKANNDNTGEGVISDADGVRIKIPYKVIAEGVISMKISVSALSAKWTDTEGKSPSSEVVSYLQGKLDYSLYEYDEADPDKNPQSWSNTGSELHIDSPAVGSEGVIILAVRFNVTDELLPSDIKGMTLTLSVNSQLELG